MFWILSIVILLISSLNVYANDSERIIKAKAEGRVVFYTTMGIDTVGPVTKAFEEKYPFLKVEVLKGNSEGLFNRAIIEHQSSNVHGDVINVSALPLLKRRKMLAVYRPRETAMFPPKFTDPDGTWVGLVGNYYVLGYNPQLVPRANAPRDWNDIIHPWWKGKIALDREDYEWFGAMLEYLGPEKGRRFMEDFAKQQLNWRKGHSLLAQLVAAGEFSSSILYAHRTQLFKDRGAPLEWVKTTKPIVVSINSVGILNNSPNPNAARLLTEFLLSEVGQKLLFAGGQIPLRSKAVPESSPLGSDQLDLFPVSDRVMERLERYKKDFITIFGLK
jgi:ABC-type Fe3+ transport system substrate-binding protein